MPKVIDNQARLLFSAMPLYYNIYIYIYNRGKPASNLSRGVYTER